MTSGIGGLGSFSSAQFEKMFTRVDVNADGAVTRDEFIAGAPDDVSADKAGSLFDKLDSEGSGALSQSDLASAFQQMAASMQAGMIQAQAQASNTGGGGERPDASELFAKLDADGDGSVTREEFVSGRPDEVSEEQASAFFDKIAGENTDSIDQESFIAAMQPPRGGGGGGQGGGQSDETFDALDTNKDGVVTREEFLAGRPEDVSEEQASALFESLAGEDAESITAEQFAAGMQGPPPPPSESDMAGMSSDDQELVEKLLAALEQGTSATSGETGNSALQQLISAIEAYTKSQQSGSALYSNSTVSALSLSA
jgi:Ca2+-binding EF-hand superfamily protein